MDGQGDRVGEHVGHDRRTGQVRCDGGSTHRRHAGEPLSEEVEESHYTMADSVCVGGIEKRAQARARQTWGFSWVLPLTICLLMCFNNPCLYKKQKTSIVVTPPKHLQITQPR